MHLETATSCHFTGYWTVSGFTSSVTTRRQLKTAVGAPSHLSSRPNKCMYLASYPAPCAPASWPGWRLCPLSLIQFGNISLRLGSPKLNTVLQMQPHKYFVERNNHFISIFVLLERTCFVWMEMGMYLVWFCAGEAEFLDITIKSLTWIL